MIGPLTVTVILATFSEFSFLFPPFWHLADSQHIICGDFQLSLERQVYKAGYAVHGLQIAFVIVVCFKLPLGI